MCVSAARWPTLGSTPWDAQREHQPLVAELALAPGDPLVVGEVPEVDLRGGPRAGGPRASPRRRGRRAGTPSPARRAAASACCTSPGPPPDPGRRGPLRRPRPPVPARWSAPAAPGGRRAARRAPRGTARGPPSGTPRAAARPPPGRDAPPDPSWASSTWDRMRAACSDEQPSGIGETHSAAVLGEQLLAHLALQLGHLLGDRGGRDVQALGRRAHRSVPGEGVERAQALQIQHVSDATRYRSRILACATRSRGLHR